ncbi:two-component sensor histidine kinase [Streptomyces sp. SID4919]|uniref:sensor histidine kinase n=1 Tax=unclassified Streptomyces TaxID=2593676 RepID=UPI0008237C90|nr:histidine kinase [Streptomyces sp. AmelKG-E11A]MYY10198.1 two-component sensor histidine kinase [Streptomyces sp. SID4919]SCK51400.1 Signal transduction histidine kinase [Streptomyces sp. AmelKG-E11A]
MTQTHQTPGPQRAKSRSPEYDLARDVLGGLRQDLFHDAFVYRPLQPLGPDSSVARWFDGRGKWAPHALVAAIAAFVWFVGTASTYNTSEFTMLVAGLLPALAVMATLVRPALAFWLVLAVAPVTVALGWGQTLWPWSEGGFLAHLVVVTIVGIRTRPRTAAWMWVLTLAFCLLANGAYNRDFGSNAAPMLFVSGVLLLLVTLWHVRREAKQEVAAERTVTAVERDRRTLLEERTTIARELHDVVAHHMSVVAIQAEAAPYRVENPPPELEQAFVTIRENAVAALTELRRVLGVVRADDYQAPDAPQPTLADLDSLLANVRETGLEVERTTTGAVRELPPGVELSAYRIVQEALSNTLRHAPGASARVEVSHVLGGLGLRVVNGPARGLVKPSPGAGHGITGMRERVAMLNGGMTAGELPEGGYEIAVFLPVPPMEETS